jgi:hypothetical protein
MAISHQWFAGFAGPLNKVVETPLIPMLLNKHLQSVLLSTTMMKREQSRIETKTNLG